MKTKFLIFSILLLILIVALEFICIRYLFFSYVPYIGIIFHVAGGFASAIFAWAFFYSDFKNLSSFALFYLVLSTTALAAVSWEVFEYLIRTPDKIYNQSIPAIIEDLVVSMIGSLPAFLFIKFLKR